MLNTLLQNNNFNKILLIEPDFPIPIKSRNNHSSLPNGLLKIGTYLKQQGIQVKLIQLDKKHNHDQTIINFNPDLILITSLFTYWAKHVKEAVKYCRKITPKTKIIIGGVFASLMPKKCKEYTKCDYIHQGVIQEAEELLPDYSLLENDIDFQILHLTRGCIRNCDFCGVNKIEPNFYSKQSIKDKIIRKNLIFYDNNLLANPYIEDILNELIELKRKKIIIKCESQSGFDGRILRKKPHLAKLLKKANFKNPKIAWDNSYDTYQERKQEIDILIEAGYKANQIGIFMLYNYQFDYNEMEQKRAKCFKWGVQVMDSRYRPLNRINDNYNSQVRRQQTNEEYHINYNWTDKQNRQFRKNVRRHNICIRHRLKYYSYKVERKQVTKEESMLYRTMEYDELKPILPDLWDPSKPYYINEN